MMVKNERRDVVKNILTAPAEIKLKTERMVSKGRIGFKHYERSQFLFGSDIADKGYYSRS